MNRWMGGVGGWMCVGGWPMHAYTHAKHANLNCKYLSSVT